jgi:hypothetical protein
MTSFALDALARLAMAPWCAGRPVTRLMSAGSREMGPRTRFAELGLRRLKKAPQMPGQHVPQILQLLFKFGQQAFCRRLFAFGKCLHINYMWCGFTVATQTL